jgi:hypothetical protein
MYDGSCTEQRRDMVDIRNRFRLAATKTVSLQRYLDADPNVSALGSEELYQDYESGIRRIVDRILRQRFQDLANEAMQEAWLDCLSELQARKAEFMKERSERPQFRPMVIALTMRAIWRLEQQTRRQRLRAAPEETGTRQQAQWNPEYDAVNAMTPLDFHRVFGTAWQRLLEHSTVGQRAGLEEVGQLEFFAGDWPSLPGSTDTDECVDALTALVLEQRCAARLIIEDILAHDFDFEARVRSKFVRTLIP